MFKKNNENDSFKKAFNFIFNNNDQTNEENVCFENPVKKPILKENDSFLNVIYNFVSFLTISVCIIPLIITIIGIFLSVGDKIVSYYIPMMYEIDMSFIEAFALIIRVFAYNIYPSIAIFLTIFLLWAFLYIIGNILSLVERISREREFAKHEAILKNMKKKCKNADELERRNKEYNDLSDKIFETMEELKNASDGKEIDDIFSKHCIYSCREKISILAVVYSKYNKFEPIPECDYDPKTAIHNEELYEFVKEKFLKYNNKDEKEN